MLSRCNLVVLGLCEDSKLPELFIKILHEALYTWLDLSEIVIIELLSLWRLVSEKGTTCIEKVRSLSVYVLIDKEVLLLRTNCCNNSLALSIAEKPKNSYSLLVKSLHRTKKRCLLIESFS